MYDAFNVVVLAAWRGVVLLVLDSPSFPFLLCLGGYIGQYDMIRRV